MYQPTSNESSSRVPRGTKQTCVNESCGRRFYDLNRPLPACPYCEARCEASAIVRHEFVMATPQGRGKRYRLEEPAAPPLEETMADEGQPTKDDETFSSPEVLLDVENDDDQSADEVLGGDKTETEAG